MRGRNAPLDEGRERRVIRYAEVNPDYTQRPAPSCLVPPGSPQEGIP